MAGIGGVGHTPIPLRKRKGFKVLGRLVRVEGKLHLRIIDVLEGEA